MIFNFDDFRSFLKAYIRQRPKRGFGEAKKIAEYLSVSSTYFSQVLSGLKQFSQEHAYSLSEYLGFSDLESEYFYYLVSLDRTTSFKLKKFYQKKLVELRKTSLSLNNRVAFKKNLSDEEKSIFYSNHLYSSVSLYTSTSESGVTIEQIEKRFRLTRKKSLDILKFLVEAGLCTIVNGRYKIGTQSTHVGTDSIHLLKHHTNWRLQAIQATENLDESELMYTVQVSLSKKDFNKLREEMVQFIQNFLETVYPSPAEEIANLNIDWFWIRD